MKKNNNIIEIVCIVIASLFIIYSAERFFSLILAYNATKITQPKTFKNDNKNIIFLSSSNLSDEETAARLVGFRSVVEKYDVVTTLEFMNMRISNAEESKESFYRGFKNRLLAGEILPAVIVAEGNYALDFVATYQDELFKDIPVVFFGVTDYDLAERVKSNPMITGEIEDLFVDDVVRVAISLIPDMNHVVLVTEDSDTEPLAQKNFSLLRSQFPGYLFSVLNTSKISQEELAESLKQIQNDHIIIFLDPSEEAEKKYLSLNRTLEFVASHTSVPVFTNCYAGIGKGFAGAFTSDHYKVGARIAEKTVRIMEGTAVSDIPYEVNDSGLYIFDLRLVKKYGLSRRKIPNGAVFINPDESFWQHYREFLIPGIFFFSGILVLAGVLFYYIMKIKRLNLARKHEHSHDYLTGLFNRSALRKTIENEIEQRAKFSIILIDLDDFRVINDLYFHECGDAFLKEIGDRLSLVLAEKDFEIARCFSDIFLIIIKNEVLIPGDKTLNLINDNIAVPFLFDGLKIGVTASVGVDVSNGDGKKTADEMLINVELARDIAKIEGKNRIVFFTDDIKIQKHIEKEISDTIEDAVFHNGFTVLFQPQIDVKTGEVYGFEALSRLTSGKYTPSQFIPVAEKNGMIPQIGRVVTEKAIRQMSRWKKEGIPLKKMAINFSAGQLADQDFVSYLENLLDIYDVPPELVEIEITESLFMGNDKKAMDLFKKFKKIGVKLALDDFGTGYSSLSYLTYLPVDMIKIDKSIIDNYLRNEDSEGFISSLSKLIHSLDMAITVEGVEEEWQFRILKKWKFDYIQGFVFCRPLNGEEAGKFVPQKIE